ncbi:hypothetical protein D3C83_221950 [compost metagenome]
MKPNTPTKITRMIHISTWCSQSMSRAICEAGSWKYQAMAWAAPDAASAARPADSAASVETSFVPFMYRFP